MATAAATGLDPVLGFALVGALGVGSQWLAWRLRMPAIVLMLAAGLAVGPGLGLLDPSRDFGDLLQPLVAIAVAIILFEGGLSLNVRSLADAAAGVRRLVIIGAPLGWAASAAALHYVAGLDWATSSVFGGIMIVTGPTVIVPLLRSVRPSGCHDAVRCSWLKMLQLSSASTTMATTAPATSFAGGDHRVLRAEI